MEKFFCPQIVKSLNYNLVVFILRVFLQPSVRIQRKSLYCFSVAPLVSPCPQLQCVITQRLFKIVKGCWKIEQIGVAEFLGIVSFQ